MNEALFLLILMLSGLLAMFLIGGVADFLIRRIRACLRDSDLPKGDL